MSGFAMAPFISSSEFLSLTNPLTFLDPTSYQVTKDIGTEIKKRETMLKQTVSFSKFLLELKTKKEIVAKKITQKNSRI